MKVEIEAVLFPAPGVRAEVEALANGREPAWYTTLNASDRPAWYLARIDGRLVGFLTVFDPSGAAAEVEAYVDLPCRRQGVFTALLARAREVWSEPARRWLLVVDRNDPTGPLVARRRGTLAFTEWTLGLAADGRPGFTGLPGGLVLTEGTADDLGDADDVYRAANGEDGHLAFLKKILGDPVRKFFVLKEHGRTVGVGCLQREEGRTMVHGLAVHPDRQGRGWGRALVLALLDLGAPGTTEFLLEVDSTNQRAESLYRSLGFTDREVTDYYEA